MEGEAYRRGEVVGSAQTGKGSGVYKAKGAGGQNLQAKRSGGHANGDRNRRGNGHLGDNAYLPDVVQTMIALARHCSEASTAATAVV